jgi:hypothetical protein
MDPSYSRAYWPLAMGESRRRAGSRRYRIM